MTDNLVSLKVDIADGVAEVTLLGPGKGNAMGPDFWRELPLVFGELDADATVRAVVLTGSGRELLLRPRPARHDAGSWAPMLGRPGARRSRAPRSSTEVRSLQQRGHRRSPRAANR